MWKVYFHEGVQEVHFSTLQTYITELLQNVMGTVRGFRERKEFVGGQLTDLPHHSLVVGASISCMQETDRKFRLACGQTSPVCDN
jgi:hypothetical protein